MKKLTTKDVKVPANVPANAKATYIKNFLTATKNTGRLMLFAGDQKVEHLNDDFYGNSDLGPIATDDNNPEHLFRIASKSTIGVFAAQYGLISHYGLDYPNVPYIVKMNSKSPLVNVDQKDPISTQWVSIDQVVELKKNSKLNIAGIGYTIYLGSEYESDMFREAAQLVVDAHKYGLLTVFWIYPRGKAVKDEKDPHLITGATGVACCLGSDFVKVNYPKKEKSPSEEIFKEAIAAAGRCRVICAGGGSMDVRSFYNMLYKQIHVSGAMGNATGRNIHQKSLDDAVRFTNGISAITLGDHDVDFAVQVYEGKKKFTM